MFRISQLIGSLFNILQKDADIVNIYSNSDINLPLLLKEEYDEDHKSEQGFEEFLLQFVGKYHLTNLNLKFEISE